MNCKNGNESGGAGGASWESLGPIFSHLPLSWDTMAYLDFYILTLLGLGLIKINDLSANFNNPRPSLILNN